MKLSSEYLAMVNENFSEASIQQYVMSLCEKILTKKVKVEICMLTIDSVALRLGVDEYFSQFTISIKELERFEFPNYLENLLKYLIHQIMLVMCFK